MTGRDVDGVLEKLVKDVEAAVHALYRGEVRQHTAKARTSTLLKDARAALTAAMATAAPAAGPLTASPVPRATAPVSAGSAAGWSRAEGEAVLKCITAWLPMGPPKTADPASRCIAAMRELTPTWGERELAHEAVRRISHP